MDSERFQRWSSHIHTLTDEQVEVVINKLKLSGHSMPATTKSHEQDNDWLFTGLILAMKQAHLTSHGNLSTLRNTKGYKRYAAHSTELMKTLEKLLLKNGGNRTTLAKFIGQTLIAYCERKRVPLTASNVLLMSPNTLQALEVVLPGYADSGVLQHLVNQLTHGKPIEFDHG